MSAASFLGIAGLVSLSGFDGLIYSVGWLVGWPVVTFLIAEPLRNLGKYTFADVVAYRLTQTPGAHRRRRSAGSRSSRFYLIAQMVGAGSLVQLLFGLPYEAAVLAVGVVMLAVRALRRDDRHDVGADRQGRAPARRRDACSRCVLCAVRHEPARASSTRPPTMYGPEVLAPGKLVTSPLEAISLGLALMFGTAGPAAHPDALLHGARRAGRAQLGVLRHRLHRLLLPHHVHPRLRRGGARRAATPSRASTRAATWPRPLLAEVVGGTAFLGFISAVAFATILAVVAGPHALGRGGALARSLGPRRPQGQGAPSTSSSRSRASRPSCSRSSRSGSASLFKGQNVAFMVGLAFAIAASANFPALLLSMTWRRFSTAARSRACSSGTVSRDRPHRAVADDPDRSAAPHDGDLPAEEPGPRHDAALVRGGHRRVAAPARCRRGAQVRGGRAANPARRAR